MPTVLKSRFPMIAAELRPRVLAAVEEAAGLVAEEARRRVPVGPGDVHLRDHISVESESDGYAVLAGDGETFYGHMVEFGTSHSAPHPFLLPAAEENVDAAAALVTAALRGL